MVTSKHLFIQHTGVLTSKVGTVVPKSLHKSFHLNPNSHEQDGSLKASDGAGQNRTPDIWIEVQILLVQQEVKYRMAAQGLSPHLLFMNTSLNWELEELSLYFSLPLMHRHVSISEPPSPLAYRTPCKLRSGFALAGRKHMKSEIKDT